MGVKQFFLILVLATMAGYFAGGRAGKLPDSFGSLSSQEFILTDNLGNTRAKLFLSGAEQRGMASGNPVLTISDPLGRVIATYQLDR